MALNMRYVFVLVLAPALAADFKHQGGGYLRRGQLEAKSVAAAHEIEESLQAFIHAKSVAAANKSQESLQALAGSCRCTFTGLCSCVQALEFMNCMRDACDSGACDCQKHHYLYACQSMRAECPSANLKCGVKEASCKKVPPLVTESSLELVADIKVMQERKCKLEEAVSDGWINGNPRIEEIEPEIQERVDTLKRRGIQTPALGCSSKDTDKFSQFQVALTAQMEKENQARETLVKKHAKKHTVEKERKVAKKEKSDLKGDHPLLSDEKLGVKDMPETDEELAEKVMQTSEEGLDNTHEAADRKSVV